MRNEQIVYNYRNNPVLENIKQDFKGTPIDNAGRFVNLEFPFIPRVSDVLKWGLSRNPQRVEKHSDSFRLRTLINTAFLQSDEDGMMWLGHATFFIRLGGKNLLIDPVFYNVPFVKRYSAHALYPSAFRKLDYLLISHDHQDHCQRKSIRALSNIYPDIKILTGLNMEDLLSPWAENHEIQTAGWYQKYTTCPGLQVFYLPSRHWSKRSLNDDNKRLWGAFVIQHAGKTAYFGGDSGYGSHYKETRKLFPVIDVAMIGCGAYKPEWFMAPNHSSPLDAVRGFHDLGAKRLVPMHYGTFDLSDEPVGEPYRILKTLEKEQKIHGQLCTLDLGEVLTL